MSSGNDMLSRLLFKHSTLRLHGLLSLFIFIFLFNLFTVCLSPGDMYVLKITLVFMPRGMRISWDRDGFLACRHAEWSTKDPFIPQA